MRARFGALRDDGVHPCPFNVPRFFHRGCGAENNDAMRFEPRHYAWIGNAKREAEDGGVGVEHGFQLRGERIWRRDWRGWRRQAEFFVNFGEETEHRASGEVLIRVPSARE